MAIGQLLDIGETINDACLLDTALPSLPACLPSFFMTLQFGRMEWLPWDGNRFSYSKLFHSWFGHHCNRDLEEKKMPLLSFSFSNNDKQISCILANQFCQTFLLLFHHDKHILFYFSPKQTVISGECANLRGGFCKIQPRPVFFSQIPKAGSLTRINKKFKKLYQECW